MKTYELTAPIDIPSPAAAPAADGISTAVLLRNAQWFTSVRWGVIAAMLTAATVSGLAPAFVRSLGIVPPARWPWVATAVLAVANTAFCLLTRGMGRASPRRLVEANIWVQIVTDLLVLTTVVHLVGSTDGHIAAFYLLHIAIACVFFGQAKSLLVIALAGALYLGCVILEIAGVLPARSIFAQPPTPAPHHDHAQSLLLAGTSVFVWVAVWYLVGTLSRAVRDRDNRLEAANRDLVAADQRMNQQVLRTTHDLKAPFSGIESNIQVLRMKHWDSLSDEVRDIVGRIEVRSQTLTRRIGDILLLGELRAQRLAAAALAPTDLREVIGAAVENVRELARTRRVSINVQVGEASVVGDRRLLLALFGNLVSNAVTYSLEGGTVEVGAGIEGNAVRAFVRDHGIGIGAEALPRIFDEYFRTREAMQRNAMSTGLGLAIVKKIAMDLGLRVRVASEEGVGTTFEVLFPPQGG